MMKTISATEAKTNFGKYIATALSEPVTISKSGHETVVLISKKEYERLEEIEDSYWAARALIAEKSGYLGEEEGAKMIEKILYA